MAIIPTDRTGRRPRLTLVTEPLRTIPAVALEYPAAPRHLRLIRREMRELARDGGATPEQCEAVALAVTEAVGNAILHAYPGSLGFIRLDADVEEGDLEVAVRDFGAGLSARDRAGLGFVLMHRLSAECEVAEHPAGGVEVWMRFPLG